MENINKIVSQPPYASPKVVHLASGYYCWTDGEYCPMVEASLTQIMLFRLLMSKSMLKRGQIKIVEV